MKRDDKQINRFGTVRKMDGDDGNKSRKREFVISTESIDRHGTSIRSDAWDLSSFSGTGFFQHESFSSDPDDALGPATVRMEDGVLIGTIDFETPDINPKADKVLRKIDNGTLKNASVGFIPHDGEYVGEGDQRHFQFTRAELTEFSVVGIPSNRDAVLRSAERIETAIETIVNRNADVDNNDNEIDTEIKRVVDESNMKRRQIKYEFLKRIKS